MYQQQLSSKTERCLQGICVEIRLESACVHWEKKHPLWAGFHLSSFMFSIFRMPLNHQAQGTSTKLNIGSYSQTAQPNTFCYGYVMPLWLSMPFFHVSMVHLSCTLLVSPNPFYLYTISCLLSFSLICGFGIAEYQNSLSCFRAGQRRWEV